MESTRARAHKPRVRARINHAMQIGNSKLSVSSVALICNFSLAGDSSLSLTPTHTPFPFSLSAFLVLSFSRPADALSAVLLEYPMQRKDLQPTLKDFRVISVVGKGIQVPAKNPLPLSLSPLFSACCLSPIFLFSSSRLVYLSVLHALLFLSPFLLFPFFLFSSFHFRLFPFFLPSFLSDFFLAFMYIYIHMCMFVCVCVCMHICINGLLLLSLLPFSFPLTPSPFIRSL